MSSGKGFGVSPAKLPPPKIPRNLTMRRAILDLIREVVVFAIRVRGNILNRLKNANYRYLLRVIFPVD